MRLQSLVLALLTCAGCRVPVPGAQGISVSVNATVRVEAEIPLVEPQSAVPLEGAAVVEFFGVPLDGVQDVVFVLDRSGSMNEPALGRIAQIGMHANEPTIEPTDEPIDEPISEPTDEPIDEPAYVTRKIDVARLELIDAIKRLPAGTRMNVLFFNNELEAFAASMVPLEESRRQELIQFVQQTVPTGRTALAPAMRTALLMNARRVVLLSDGLGNLGGDYRAVLRDAREAIRGGVRIDTIGLGKQDGLLLGALAHESGGLYQAL